MTQIDDIRADIAAFADDEDSVIMDKGLIVFMRERQEYACRLLQETPGQIEIEVNGRRMLYYRFLAEELGRLSILAESVRQKRKDVVPYIDTQATLTDSSGEPSKSGSALKILRSRCVERTVGESTLIFLTAEAGEGKTALLRRLSQLSASEYLSGNMKTLLLHIDTQGRSFVRLEEAVARELGQLRISGLFYGGVVRLIRSGLLAIAIDGFDELLAEIGSGEAYSGLGAFLRQLDGSGTIIAAARSAYFQAENYAAQTRLLSSLQAQVSVEQMRLEKWGRAETTSFFTEYRNEDGSQIPDPKALYDEIAGLVGEDHVILQRPFLVHTIARMLASTPGAAQDIVRDIGESGIQVVPGVIKAFLKREVEEKWRDPSGQPYLTLGEHIHLLAAIADELWTQRTKSLPVELLQLVTETVIDEFKMPLPRRVQVVERIKAHVMLPAGAAMQPDHRAFDHDEFLDYFLAVRLAELLSDARRGDLRRFLERAALPSIVARWVALIRDWSEQSVRRITAALNSLSKAEVRSSYLKQNAGMISARLAGAAPGLRELRLESMYFKGDDWAGTTLIDAQFLKCIFNGVDLSDCNWRGCSFIECDFQSLTINAKTTNLSSSKVDRASHVVGVLKSHQDDEALRSFVPDVCKRMLEECGVEFEHPPEEQLKLELGAIAQDVRNALTRFLRIFSRSSGATENVIRMKLGAQLHLFEKVVLPELLDSGVIRPTEYRGSGGQKRYELNFPVDVILTAEDPTSSSPEKLKSFWNKLRHNGSTAK